MQWRLWNALGRNCDVISGLLTYQALVFPSGKSSIAASNVSSTVNQLVTLHANLCKPENIWRGFLVRDSWKYWQVHRTKTIFLSLPLPPLWISLPECFVGSVKPTISQRLLAWVAKIGLHTYTWSTYPVKDFSCPHTFNSYIEKR